VPGGSVRGSEGEGTDVTSERSVLRGRRILLGVTGGIAAYKACILVRLLRLRGASVRVVMTRSAERFVGPATFAALSEHRVYTDLFEEPGVVLHVRLAHEADLAVIAPATANVIAKLAQGIADDLLTSTLLEARCPLVVAPAMHTGMWEHPATQSNVSALAERGARIVGPAQGALAAGDEGLGRMTEPEDILTAIEDVLAAAGDLTGRRVVVTAGPTWEPIDPVRFVGNRSTGKMGFAIAAEAFGRGADVTLIAGPGTVEPPPGPDVLRVTTAEEMRSVVVEAVADADALVMAAAVADFRPEHAADTKLKKDQGPPEVRLVPTPDILAELGSASDAVLVGFAAETEDVVEAGREKLRRKGLQLLVANEVGRDGTGFGSDTNRAAIVAADGTDVPLREWTKRELASAICDRLAKLLTA
jgi:phosphopantothenoylcysteine decarboxylase / phosphopantothenate---cysteine ligase